jgi:prepilin-type N-terminal cleavage/methylation domain-containing protein
VNLNRKGFTIIEVMISILILTVGLLAMASTAGLVTRMIGQSKRFEAAAELAAERIELIVADPTCPLIGSGSATSGANTVAWRVTAFGRGERIQVIVNWPLSAGNTRADTFHTVYSCHTK